MNKHMINWMEKYNYVKMYIEETGKIPTFSTKYKDVCIGAWIRTQQKKLSCDDSKESFSKLTNEQLELLEKIGIQLKKPEIKTNRLRTVLTTYGYGDCHKWPELAKNMGISTEVFKKYVYGSRNLYNAKSNIVMKLSKILGCNPLELIDFNESIAMNYEELKSEILNQRNMKINNNLK